MPKVTSQFDAAIDGLGIGTGPLPVLQADIMAGWLLTPCPEIAAPRAGYVVLIPFDANKRSSLATFLDWLVAEESADPASDGGT